MTNREKLQRLFESIGLILGPSWLSVSVVSSRCSSLIEIYSREDRAVAALLALSRQVLDAVTMQEVNNSLKKRRLGRIRGGTWYTCDGVSFFDLPGKSKSDLVRAKALARRAQKILA